MTIAFMESCWYALALAVTKWQNSLARVPAPCNTGSVVLRIAVLLACKIRSVQVVLLPWTKALFRDLEKICVALRVSWAIPRTFGMENCLAITLPRNSASTWVSANASGCSGNWDFAGANRVPSLLNLIRKQSGNIKKLRRLAARDDLDLWFEDECHFQQHGSRCTMWIPPEEADPVVFHAPTRKSLGIFGAVRIDNGQLVTSQENKFDTMTFLSFLKQLLRHRRRGRMMVVILDNARWHHARLLKPWLKKHRHILRLDFLPPYSPELNPIERVWKLTRKLCTHNCYFPDLADLGQTISTQFELWQKPNETIRRLCAII